MVEALSYAIDDEDRLIRVDEGFYRFAAENGWDGAGDSLGRSQAEFALMIGVSVATLQNWEQGRRRPVGPARALLKVAASNPRLVMRALAS